MTGVNSIKFFLFYLSLAVLPIAAAQTTNAQDLISSHRGAVTAILMDDSGRIISSGEDGFMQIWDRQKNAPAERSQIGFYSIKSMALRPGKPEIAFIQSSDDGKSRVAVWNYETKQNLFNLPFDDSTNNVFYSAAGSFLLITGSNGVKRVNSDTGIAMSSPAADLGDVSFAATGRSERSMVACLKSGSLSYWDLESGNATGTVNVPVNLGSPLLLGNNRFLAGFDIGGLVILDAVSGKLLVRETGIRNGTLFTGNPDGLEFICMVPGIQGSLSRNPSILYHLSFNVQSSRLQTVNRRNVPSSMPLIDCGVIIAPDAVALGTTDGRVIILNQNGTAKLMDTKNQTAIADAAASSNALAFRTENSQLGFIPADFSSLDQGSVILTEDSGPYTAITAGDSDFLLWQPQNTRTFPLIKHLSDNPEYGSVSETYINKLTLRFPLRSASIYGNLYLFMDTVGNITIINQDSGEIIFTYLSSGAQDAAFIDDKNILIGRSAGQGSSAFVMVNIVTGETVPLPLSVALGARVYRGSTGDLFGAAISSSFKTSLVSINSANPARSFSLTEVDAEDPGFPMAESRGILAAAMDNGNARLFAANTFYDSSVQASNAAFLERSPGLPVILTNSANYIISVDSDGNICWYDPPTGKIQAVFRLFTDSWILNKADGTSVSGKVQAKN
ncbi:MAG: hypothetical protein FWF22_04055 [Treponema sp.]|nr:hypothetical protein [Treponema sp.]